MRSFSFSNFDATRRRNLAGSIKSMAFVKLGVAGVLFLLNPFLGIWVGTAGLVTAGIAGCMRLPDVILRPKFQRARNTELRIKVFRSVRVHNHARAYRRSASRPALAVAGGGDDSDGGSESDSGEPPGPSYPFHVTPFQNFYRKSNSFLSPLRLGYALDCWCSLCCHCPAKGVLS